MNKFSFILWIFCCLFVYIQRVENINSNGNSINNKQSSSVDVGQLNRDLEITNDKPENLEKRFSRLEKTFNQFKDECIHLTDKRLEAQRNESNQKIADLEANLQIALTVNNNNNNNCCADNTLEISSINQKMVYANSKIDNNLKEINDQERQIAIKWQSLQTQVHENTVNVGENSGNLFGNVSLILNNLTTIHRQQNLKFSSVFSGIKAVENNLIKKTRNIEEHSEKIETISQEVGYNAAQIQEIRNNLTDTGISSRKLLEIINRNLQNLNKTLLDSSELSKINAGHIDEYRVKIEENAIKVESCCSKANAGISALVEQNSKKIEGLFKSFQQNSGKIDENAKKVIENSRNISGIFDKVQQNAENVQDLSATLSNAVDAIEDIKGKCEKIKDLSLLVQENSKIIRENSGKIVENSKHLRDTVAKTVENLNKIEQNLGKIDTNSERIRTNSLEMKTVLDKQKQNSEKLKENSRKLDQSSKQIGENSRISRKNEKKIDENGKKLQQENAKNILNSNQKIQNNLLLKIGENSKQIKTHSQKIQDLSKNFEGIAKNVNKNGEKVDENSRKITSNKQKIAESDIEIDKNAQKINSNRQKMAENENKIDKNTKNVDENTKNVKDTKKKIDDLISFNDEIDRRKEEYEKAINKIKNNIYKAEVTPSAATPTNLSTNTLWDPQLYQDSRPPLSFTWTINDISAKLGQNLPNLESAWFKFPPGYPFEAKSKLFIKNSTEIMLALVFKDPGTPFSKYFPFPQITYALKDQSGNSKDRVTSASLLFNGQKLRADDKVLEEFLLLKPRLLKSRFVKDDDSIVVEIHVESPLMAQRNQSENGELFNGVDHFEERKQLAHDYSVWYTSSPYFYTHPGGYRVQLRMYFNINGQILPHLLFLTTDHDRALPDSFPHRITLTMFNPRNNFKNNLVIEKEADIGDYGLRKITYDQVEDLVVHNTLYYHVKIEKIDYVI